MGSATDEERVHAHVAGDPGAFGTLLAPGDPAPLHLVERGGRS